MLTEPSGLPLRTDAVIDASWNIGMHHWGWKWKATLKGISCLAETHADGHAGKGRLTHFHARFDIACGIW